MSMIVTRNGRDARRIDTSGVPAEDFLQEYIARNPQALPFSELREDLRLMVVAREFATSSGPIDAVAIDGDGNVYLIETKLYRNPDKRRVLAQVMDYGAALWEGSGSEGAFRDRLDEAVRRSAGESLVEQLGTFFGIDPDESEALVAEADRRVAKGQIRFVVLMDHIDDRLKTLISYINENSRFDVFAVELQFYRFDDYEVTIPRLYGAEARKEVDGGSATHRRRWDKDRYFEDVASRDSSPEAIAATRQLYDFATEHADRVTWGMGATVGSFSFRYDRVHPTKSLLAVYSHGRIDLNFNWLCDAGQPLPVEAQQLADRLGRLEGWTLPDDFATTFPHLKAEVWVPQVEKIIDALRISFEPGQAVPATGDGKLASRQNSDAGDLDR